MALLVKSSQLLKIVVTWSWLLWALRLNRRRSGMLRPLSAFSNRKSLAPLLIAKVVTPLMRFIWNPLTPSALVRSNHVLRCSV